MKDCSRRNELTTGNDDAGSEAESESSEEIYRMEFMYWPLKVCPPCWTLSNADALQPVEDYLAWLPRVTKEDICVRHQSFRISELHPGVQHAIFGTELDADHISYYDFERSVWITLRKQIEIPVLRSCPLLLRDLTLQDEQCLGWEAAVEAAGYPVIRPIRKGPQPEGSGHKSKSKYHPYSRPTNNRRVSPSRSPMTERLNASRDEEDCQGSTRGRHSWWMEMSAGEAIEGLGEMEIRKAYGGRTTLQQRFRQAFPGKQFTLSTVKRMIAVFNHLSEEECDHYVDEDPEHSWGEIYARLAKKS